MNEVKIHPPEPVVIDPARTAVLLLHFQNELLKYKPGLSHYGPEFPDACQKAGTITNAKRVLDASREKGVRVIFVRVAYRPGAPELPPQNELLPGRKRTREKGFFMEGTWNTEIIDELKPLEDEVVVTNNSISAFGWNDLELILRNNNVRYLILGGVVTKTIVTCTAIDAYGRGYFPYVLGDCCNSWTQEEHNLYLHTVLPSYAVISDSSQYISALEQIAKP